MSESVTGRVLVFSKFSKLATIFYQKPSFTGNNLSDKKERSLSLTLSVLLVHLPLL